MTDTALRRLVMKAKYLMSILALSVLLTGCNGGSPNSVPPHTPDMIQSVSNNTTSANDIAVGEEVTLTKSKLDSMLGFMSDKTFANVVQTNENLDADGVVHASGTQEIKADLENDILYSVISTTTEDSYFELSYADNYADNTHFVKVDDNWVENSVTTFDFSSKIVNVNSVLDLYNNTLYTFKPEEDLTGIFDGTYERYLIEVEPSDYDVEIGISYDTLDKETVEYVLYKDGEEYIFDSAIVSLYYTVGTDNYVARTTIKFEEISNRQLTMPIVETTEEGSN